MSDNEPIGYDGFGAPIYAHSEPRTLQAERLAAALALVLYDAHPTYGSTALWHGGAGGQAITAHCSIINGPPPGDDWSQFDMPSKALREFMDANPEFDLEAAKKSMKAELLADLYPEDDND